MTLHPHGTILAVVVGSRAYGLHGPDSDHERRGVHAAPTRAFWHLDKPPTHLEGPRDEQFSWEIERFCELALQANPTVLETLWSPLIEHLTPTDGQDLISVRDAFLSRRVADTYGAYARSQLTRLRNRHERTGTVNHKQAMHMIRLLLAGAHTLRTGDILVDVSHLRTELLAVKTGTMPLAEVLGWADRAQADLDAAARTTTLPERPDRDRVDALLGRVRERNLAVHAGSPGRRLFP